MCATAALMLLLNHASAQAVDADIQLNEQGALMLAVDGDALLTDVLPKLYFLNFLVDGEKQRPEWHWMTKGEYTYDAATQTMTVKHQWGQYTITYKPGPDRLDMRVTIQNSTDKLINDLHLWLVPNLKFPQTPKGYAWSKGWGAKITDSRPAVALADWGPAAVVLCLQDRGEHVSATMNKQISLAVGQLQPGQSRTVDVSLRIGPGSESNGDSIHALAEDIYANYRTKHPHIVKWPDRRPIAALHPSSAHLGSGTVGKTTNPRGWIFGTQQDPVDVTTEQGRTRFTQQMMDFAHRSVEIIRDMNGQGMICWSLEGQQFPHTISYVGDPQLLAELAPEMDAIADQWFKVFDDAGIKTGICLRPQQLVRNPAHDPDAPPEKPPYPYSQRNQWTPEGEPDYDAVLKILDDKITYAKQRWGCTIYYIDTNVASKYTHDKETGKWKNSYWKVHAHDVYTELSRRHPDCLIIPEHEYFAYWAGSVPLAATPVEVQRVWPDAFSVNLMQNFNHEDQGVIQRLEKLVRRGDILIFPGWYLAKSNPVVKGVYTRNHVERWHGPAKD